MKLLVALILAVAATQWTASSLPGRDAWVHVLLVAAYTVAFLAADSFVRGDAR